MTTRLTEKIKMIPIRELVETQEEYEKLLQISREHNKLVDLESIEEELGIDFLLLDKICQKGVYCYKKSIKDFDGISKRLGDIIHIQNSDIHIDFFGCYKEKRMGVSIMGCIDFVYHSLPIKDYGITWALTKEELENDNHD